MVTQYDNRVASDNLGLWLASPLSVTRCSVLLTFCGANLHSAARLIPTTVLFNFDVGLILINNVIGLSFTCFLVSESYLRREELN